MSLLKQQQATIICQDQLLSIYKTWIAIMTANKQ